MPAGVRVSMPSTRMRNSFSKKAYATDGMRMVISEVFSRLSGDNTALAIHRLETAFGGGKTHTLIACTYLAYRGRAASPFLNKSEKPF